MSLAQYTIVMWYGTLATIPAGWQICDGTGGTPDLRNRFVKGAAAGNAGDDTAHGGDTHSHDLSLRAATIKEGTGAITATSAHLHTTSAENHEPPYKHLVFIMKT